MKRSRQQAEVITTALRLLVVGNAEFSQLAPRKLTLCHATNVTSINVVRIGTANHFLLRKIKPPRSLSLRKVLRECLHAAFKPAAVELTNQSCFIQPTLGEFPAFCVLVMPAVTRTDRNFAKEPCFRMDKE